MSNATEPQTPTFRLTPASTTTWNKASKAAANPLMPAPGQPGTLGEQLAAIVLSIQLASRHGTTSAEQWDTAQQEIRRRTK